MKKVDRYEAILEMVLASRPVPSDPRSISDMFPACWGKTWDELKEGKADARLEAWTKGQN